MSLTGVQDFDHHVQALPHEYGNDKEHLGGGRHTHTQEQQQAGKQPTGSSRYAGMSGPAAVSDRQMHNSSAHVQAWKPQQQERAPVCRSTSSFVSQALQAPQD